MNPEEWRREYENSRYLREIYDAVLKQRLDDLKSNLWSTDAAGNVVPLRDSNRRCQLLRLILHVILEQMERAKMTRFDFDERALREASAAEYRPPRLKTPFAGSPLCFAKFGRREHIADAFDRGILLIRPGSSYGNDPSLNSAQADKELEHATITPNQHLMFKLYGRDAEGNEVELPVQKKELFQYMMVPDFYVWCCGLGYDARLFHDFQYDAVLIIRDKDAFRARLSACVARVLPTGRMTDGPLRYYDPYTVRREELGPIFSKHFRYLYQNEYRFAWVVPRAEPLKQFFVNLGPLHVIADFVELA
jgi:hypothetical protein